MYTVDDMNTEETTKRSNTGVVMITYPAVNPSASVFRVYYGLCYQKMTPTDFEIGT